jgi:endoribonuclease Dicer
MVASDVLEEGIDIPKCNLVVKFDTPKNYRSYIQSKGRARYQSSKYYIMVPRDKGNTFSTTYKSYRNTEDALRNVSTNLITILIRIQDNTMDMPWLR